MRTEDQLEEHFFEYIRKAYGVPARKGGRVLYTGGREPREGTIIGNDNGRLQIRLDGDTLSGVYHPKWELKYVEENDVNHSEHDASAK